jgi:hypothetical protein
MRAKKAHVVLIPLVVLVGIVALISCFTILLGKTEGVERRLGQEQFRLLEVYQFGEDFQQYLGQAGKYSAQQSIVILSDVGWQAAQPGCDQFNGYVLWNSRGRDCYPATDPMRLALSVAFSNLLKEYTRPYLGDNIINYNLELTDEAGSLQILAIPDRKVDFIIGTNKDEKAPNPNIIAINLGDVIDREALLQRIQEAEQSSSSQATAGQPEPGPVQPPETAGDPKPSPQASAGGGQ